MVLRLLIDAVHPEETRVVIADNSRIHDFDFVTASKKQVKGNIYLAKITRVEPSLQAAFVEYGGGKQGFLPFAEIHPDYYQIPTADRKRLLDEAEEAAEESEESAQIFPPEHASGEDNQPAATESNGEAPVFSEPVQETGEQLEVLLAEPIATPFAPEETAIIAAAFEAPVTYSESDPVETPAPAAFAEPATEVEASTSQTETPAEAHSEHNEQTSEAQEIETLASEEDAVRQARPASFYRRYKIQEVIKRNQIVLVQVIKEERGNKGVSLTTFISLAGRYCVLMPNSPKGGGISRKIMSGDDRKRLKEISAELKTARGMSAIIRTAGIDRTRAEIKRDYEYLVKLWESIREQTLSSTAPALIYEEGDLIKRTIRDLYSNDIEEIVVEGEEGFNQARDFLGMILASHAPRVKLYNDNVPLFYAYNIEDQLASMYDPIVKLRSGGYIVLNPTEALISIDVNSGRSTGERNIEETAAKTNLEAAAEIARQLRLRDLAGLVVIDFIDMMDSRNRRAVERALKDALKLDRAKIQLGRISPFGLLEMSRQRLRPSLSESSTMPCPLCQARGVIRSDASVAIQIIRALEKEAASGLYSDLKLTVIPSVAVSLLNSQRDALSALEKRYSINTTVVADAGLPQGNFRIEKVKSAQPRRNANPNAQEPVSLDQKILSEMPPMEEASGADAEIMVSSDAVSSPSSSYEERPQRRGRRGGRGRSNRDRNDKPYQERNNMQTAPAETSEAATPGEAVEGQQPQTGEARPPRERGERGGRNRRGRNWRDKRNRNDNNTNGAAPSPDGNVVQYQPQQSAQQSEPRTQSYAPRQSASSGASVPPLGDQGSADSKPKKGWWRRIVES